MGRTPKPLVIIALDPVSAWDEVQKLRDQGHTVTTLQEFMAAGQDPMTVDLFLGPTCWRMDEQHRKYLGTAITAGRQARYPKEKS